MTNKEIIIGGVDVSGCEFHTTRFFGYVGQNYCKIYDCVCEEPICDNCDYKQLQRLTAQYNAVVEQNKSLQSEVLTLKNKNNILETELSQTKLLLEGKNKQSNHLQQEYKELKTYIKEDLAPHAQMLQNENNRYRRALEEIENFMIYEFSGQNEWVKTSVLNIINKAKEVQCE